MVLLSFPPQVGQDPILDADAYTCRLDLQHQPQAATYRGIGPSTPTIPTAETQVCFRGSQDA